MPWYDDGDEFKLLFEFESSLNTPIWMFNFESPWLINWIIAKWMPTVFNGLSMDFGDPLQSLVVIQSYYATKDMEYMDDIYYSKYKIKHTHTNIYIAIAFLFVCAYLCSLICC